jgi:hypothetical protein
MQELFEAMPWLLMISLFVPEIPFSVELAKQAICPQ